MPFYAGAPDIGKVLPPESFIPIPLDAPDEAEHIIADAVRNDEYSRRLPSIREARRLIIEKYNTYSQVVAVVEAEKNIPVASHSPSEFIDSRHRLRWLPAELISAGAYWLRRIWAMWEGMRVI